MLGSKTCITMPGPIFSLLSLSIGNLNPWGITADLFGKAAVRNMKEYNVWPSPFTGHYSLIEKMGQLCKKLHGQNSEEEIGLTICSWLFLWWMQWELQELVLSHGAIVERHEKLNRSWMEHTLTKSINSLPLWKIPFLWTSLVTKALHECWL